jgi:hypothetical protein
MGVGAQSSWKHLGLAHHFLYLLAEQIDEDGGQCHGHGAGLRARGGRRQCLHAYRVVEIKNLMWASGATTISPSALTFWIRPTRPSAQRSLSYCPVDPALKGNH